MDSPRGLGIVFDEPCAAVAPGQAVVFYGGGTVVGGGWIDRGAAASPYSDSRWRSASMAAMQPVPAAVIACR